jgi:hypothetical protein
MQDRLPQGDPPLLDQLLKFYAPDRLLSDNVVHQPIIPLQQGFQAVRAACLSASEKSHAFSVANS